MLNNSFKKFGGEKIISIVDYLKENLDKDPNLTISIGCDSKQLRHKTMYANTVIMYNEELHNGAHVVFNRTSIDRVPDTFTRLYHEAEYMNELGNFIHDSLSEYKRNDINEYSRKKYKFHLMQHSGKYQKLEPYEEYNVIKSLFLSEEEKLQEFKLVDIHLDYNMIDEPKNRSYVLTRSTVPWLRSQGFRAWTKPFASAASSCADLLLKR